MDYKSDQEEQVHINAANQDELFPVMKQPIFSEYVLKYIKIF